MEQKRKISIFLPYFVKDKSLFVFLQKRTKDAVRLPDYFGFFGGGAEGDETPEETLKREVKEELDFVPEGYVHFKKYEFPQSVKDVFLYETDIDFQKRITVLEGEYGKWFSLEEALAESKFYEEDKTVVKDLIPFLLPK